MSVSAAIDIAGWVAEAKGDSNKEFRQAIHTVLYAISQGRRLQPNMVLKGGILLAIKYNSQRFTKDIDLSTPLKEADVDIGAILIELNACLAMASESLDYGLECLVQKAERSPKQEDATYPSIKISIGYAYKGTSKQKKLHNKQSPTVIRIDYSLNEAVVNEEAIAIADGEEILVYTIIDLVAEKLRSLLQQEVRERYRRQDIFDIFMVLSMKNGFDADEKSQILDSLLFKSRARGIQPVPDSFDNPEVRRRAGVNYQTLQDEIEGDLPDFTESFDRVAAFYRSLPW